MDPLSIAAGVAGLLGVCYQVGPVLMNFYGAVEIVDTKLNGLQGTVESFVQVLTLMKDTLKRDEIQTSFRATGHISNHWTYLSSTIKDGQETLSQLRDLLEGVNRSASVLSGTRKHARLQRAAEEIGVYEQQIQCYKDTLQLSLQVVTVWSQATLQESTDKILPKLAEVEQEIQRMALTFRRSMTELQSIIESRTAESQSRDGNRPQASKQLRSLKNLMRCVDSAATIVSDASTTLGIDQGRGGSEFGDYLTPERGETMIRWISENTVHEEHPDPDPSAHQRRGSTRREADGESGDKEFDDPDYDPETALEEEMIQSLIARGQQALREEKFSDAESDFFNSLHRIKAQGSEDFLNRMSKPKSELINLLLKTYLCQDKLEEAQSHLMDAIRSDPSNLGLLSDMLSLIETLFEKEDYQNALACGRYALIAYRKLGPVGAAGKQMTLQLLIKVCKAHGNHADQRAFEAMLSHPRSHAQSQRESAISADCSPRNSTPNSSLSSGTLLDLSIGTRSIRTQSQRTNSSDLPGPIGEEDLGDWRGLSSLSVSTITPGASSSVLFSDDQHSPWYPNSTTTPEFADSVGWNNGGKPSEAKTHKRHSSGTVSDAKVLPLSPSRGYFDSQRQPSSLPMGRRVQSWSSTSSGLGQPLNIDNFEKEVNTSFNGLGLLEQPRSITTREWMPTRKEYGSETTSDSSWLEKEDEKENPQLRKARTRTMSDIGSIPGSLIKLNASTSQAAKPYKKVIVVGDSKCGKTPLLTRIKKGYFAADPPPTQWELYTLDTEIESKRIEFAIWELGAGAHDREGFSTLRSSPGPYAFLVCFAIDCPDSLAKIKKRWVSNVQDFDKNAPYILVGLKSDLRSDPRIIEDLRRKEQSPVTPKQGQDVANMIKAEQYLECSAKTGQGVREVLDAATRLTLVSPKDWKRKQKDEKHKKDDEMRAKGGEDKESHRKKSFRHIFNKSKA